jgi:hypothetical protein
MKEIGDKTTKYIKFFFASCFSSFPFKRLFTSSKQIWQEENGMQTHGFSM